MYYPYFIAYIVIGFGISLLVFGWALRSGQFRDQHRARFLPLRDLTDGPPVRISRFSRIEIYSLFVLVAIGLVASAALLMYAVYFSK